jgi:hypothetical protein
MSIAGSAGLWRRWLRRRKRHDEERNDEPGYC